MELKNYEFTRSVVFQGKFSAAPGDTLMQTAEEMFVYSGRRGTQEVLLRVKTITTYLKEGWLKEVAGLDEPGEEPKKAVKPVIEPVVVAVVPPAPPKPKAPEHVIDVTARVVGAPEPVKAPEHKPKPEPDPIVIVPHPKPTPPVAIKKPDAPKAKTAAKPAAKPTPATKEVVSARPEKVSPILEAALGENEAGIDAVLARTKKVVRKNR